MSPKFGMGKGLSEAARPENLDFGKKLGAGGAGVDAVFGDGSLAEGLGPSDGFTYCDPEHIEPNPDQPRKKMDKAGLEALAASIAERGLLQPLVVRRLDRGYQLIAGERRWRACRMAGLKRIPVVVKDSGPGDSLLLALIENVQREDLNPIEEAEALARIKQETDLTQAQLAGVVHKDRSTVANALRLLALPVSIREDVASGALSPGHARAILSLEGGAKMRAARNEIIKKGLSVRQAEALVKRMGQARPPRRRADDGLAVQFGALGDELRKKYGTKVGISGNADKGKIVFEYYSSDELERLLEMLRG